MIFRRIGSSKCNTPASRRTLLQLEGLEERSVPSATDLGAADNFNAFIFKNYTGANSDVEGQLAVGNNAALTNYGVGGSLPNSHGTVNDLIVGNSLNYHNGEVFNGNIVYGTSASIVGVGVPNGTIAPGNPVNFGAAQTDLDSKSALWATYGANGTAVNNWGGLFLTGTSSTLNVFNLTASQLQNIWGITINAPAGSTVLINVSGTSATMQYFGVNINGTDASRVLFNFSQATSLSMQGIGFPANILAPYANVNFSNGNITGTLVAKCFTGTGQLDWRQSNIDIPQSLPSVISGKVFLDTTGSGIPGPGSVGITPVYVILQGNGTGAYYSVLTDANGNFSIPVTQADTYTMSIIDATGLGYTLVSLQAGTAGGTASLIAQEILNITLGSGTNGQNYYFGLQLPGDTGGEHP